MRHPPEVHGVEFFTVRDLHGRPMRLAIGVAEGAVAVALLPEGQPLVVDEPDAGVTVLALAPVEVPPLQRRLGAAMTAAAKQQWD